MSDKTICDWKYCHNRIRWWCFSHKVGFCDKHIERTDGGRYCPYCGSQLGEVTIKADGYILVNNHNGEWEEIE